jgi:hypothetical protein
MAALALWQMATEGPLEHGAGRWRVGFPALTSVLCVSNKIERDGGRQRRANLRRLVSEPCYSFGSFSGPQRQGALIPRACNRGVAL